MLLFLLLYNFIKCLIVFNLVIMWGKLKIEYGGLFGWMVILMFMVFVLGIICLIK